MIFSENGRLRHRSRRHSRLRRRAVNGISVLSGVVVLSLAALSLAMALLPGEETPASFVYKPKQTKKVLPAADKAQHILDETLEKLATVQTAAVAEAYDTCDTVVAMASDTPAEEHTVVDEELDQTIPSASDPDEEIFTQRPADRPAKQYAPAGPSVAAIPGFAPNSATPFGRSLPHPKLAAAPRQRQNRSPFGGPSTPPQNSFPGGGTPSFPPVSGSPPPIVTKYTPPPETPDRSPELPPIIADYTPPPATPEPEPVLPPMITGGPETPQAPTGTPPTDGDPGDPYALPPDSPWIADNDWYSPGHSPGIATVAGDFNLDGRTILFEILGTEAGLEYDQLQVEGIANLNEGNVVFAFINDFVADSADFFDLILASEVLVDLEKVNFYYGLFDPADDPSYNLHAPQNLSLYSVLNYKDSIDDDVTLFEAGGGTASINTDGLLAFDELMRIGYLARGGQMERGPDQNFTPVDFGPSQNPAPQNDLASVPEPAPLLLLASSLLLLRRFRKGKAS